jgi:hypothetical protein
MLPEKDLPQEVLDSPVPVQFEVLEAVPEKDITQVVTKKSSFELPLIQSQPHSPALLISPGRLKSPPRHSIKFKVKGLMSGTTKSKAHLASGSSLLAQFPFTRLIDAEITGLFRTYRVQLGSDPVQRDIIISSIRGMQRDNFGSVMEQLIARSKTNTFEMVTVVLMASVLGSLGVKLIF